MDRHAFEITFDTASAHTGKVVMDGVELRGVTGVEFRAYVQDSPGTVALTITFLPEKILARLADPEVLAMVHRLKAETTTLGATNRTYCLADPAISKVD